MRAEAKNLLPMRMLAYGLLVFALVVFGVLSRAFWRFTVDDAFITFRYARHLAAGLGPVYNPGEPGEGYTSILWLMLMAIPHRLGVDVVVSAKVFGAATALWLAFVLYRLTYRLVAPNTPRQATTTGALAAALLLTRPATAVHAVAGLETMLFAALLTWFVWQAVDLARAVRPRTVAVWATVGLLATLTRPEGIVVVLPVVLATLPIVPSGSRRALLWMFTGIYAVPLTGYWLWRWSYYDLFFPLPFYVKLVSPGGLAGVHDVMEFINTVLTPLLPLSALGVLFLGRRAWPVLVGVTSLLVFFVLPEHLMDYDWRYLYPTVPSLLILAALGVAGIVGLLRDEHLTPALFTILSVLLHIGILAWLSWDLRPRSLRWNVEAKHAYGTVVSKMLAPLGTLIGSLGTGSRPLVLATADAGAIPYYSDCRTVDTFGLNDPQIARLGFPEPDYVLSQKPDLVFLNSRDPELFIARMPWVEDLYRGCRANGLVPVLVIQIRHAEYYTWVMGEPTAPAVQRLYRQLGISALQEEGGHDSQHIREGAQRRRLERR